MLRKMSLLGWRGAVAVTAALFVGIMAVGCGSDSGPSGPGGDGGTQSGLNGTWTGINDDGDEESITLSGSNFTLSINGSQMVRGNFSTSGNNITRTINEINGTLLKEQGAPGVSGSTWYTKESLKTAIKNSGYPISDADLNGYVNEVFGTETGTYSVNGDNLTTTFSGETTSYTKKPTGNTPGTNPNNPGGTTQTGLNGTWSDSRGYVITFDNNTMVMKYPIVSGGKPVNVTKGTYSVSGSNIILNLTHMHGDVYNAQFEQSMPGMSIESKWYTLSELKIALRNLVGADAYDMLDYGSLIDELYGPLFTTQTIPYTLNGNSLTFSGSTYTRQLSKAIAAIGRDLSSKGSSNFVDNIGVSLRNWLGQ
jgi:hypothetical protein